MEKIKTSFSQQMINTLLLHSSFIRNLGLLNGKMGISIFFYHLARKTGNLIYEDYAGELIDEIYEDINLNTPLDFANGLAGIGWGIEYLVQNHFIEADTDEVLGEIDKRLMPLIYSLTPSLGLCQGVVGLGAYLLKRIQNPATSNEKIQTLINKQLMVHLIKELDRRTQDVSDIIREPFLKIKKENETRNTKSDKEATAFDMIWDYPMLLILLSEIFKCELFNEDVSNILQRLASSLLTIENYPQLHSNRLLLALALTKLNHERINPFTDTKSNKQKITTGFKTNIEIEGILKDLLLGINRESIVSELAPNNCFIRNGIMGIAWIYQKLFEYTAVFEYKVEANYWRKVGGFRFEMMYQEYVGFSINTINRTSAFGVIEGLAGIAFCRMII